MLLQEDECEPCLVDSRRRLFARFDSVRFPDREGARRPDIRSTGSGNIGAANVARSAGALAGALTLFFDAGKGYLGGLAREPLDERETSAG